MQIRCESASNKQNNILVNNHQGTRCSGTGSSAGATEKSEALSYLLRTLKIHFFFILSVHHLKRGCITLPLSERYKKKCAWKEDHVFLDTVQVQWHFTKSTVKSTFKIPSLICSIFNYIIICHIQLSSVISKWWAKIQKYYCFLGIAIKFTNINHAN